MKIRNWGYPVLIWLVALGLVVKFGVVDYVMESDALMEYGVFMAIVESRHWVAYIENLLSHCLMTTWVPAQLVLLLGLPPFQVFAWYVFVLASLLPVTVYFIARRWLNPHYAFLAGLFIIMQMYFWGALRSARLNVACVVFALMILVMWSKSMKMKIKLPLVALLSFVLVISHYSTTYIAIFAFGTVLVGALLLWLVKRVRPCVLVPMGLALVVLVVSVGVLYGVLSKTPLRYGLFFIESAISVEQFEVKKPALTESETATTSSPQYSFFALETRESVIQVAFGKTLHIMNTPQKIEFAFSWLLVLALSFGFLVALWRSNLDTGYKVLCGAMCSCLLLGIALPVISNKYGIVRVFYQASIPLSVCFVIGARELGKYIKVGGYAIALSVIVPYYLCVSGVIHSWFGVIR
ncbi:hypothetical protein ES703_18529 [subsurface metagenome]